MLQDAQEFGNFRIMAVLDKASLEKDHQFCLCLPREAQFTQCVMFPEALNESSMHMQMAPTFNLM